MGANVVICLEQGADLHMAKLMPLPLTVSCFNKIRLVLPFWYWLTQRVPEKRAVKQLCVCVCSHKVCILHHFRDIMTYIVRDVVIIISY